MKIPHLREMTVQQLADFFARQAMLGRGQHSVRLCPRGLDGHQSSDVVLPIVVPFDGEVFSEKDKVVFVRVLF